MALPLRLLPALLAAALLPLLPLLPPRALAEGAAPALTVCADPANLPYSDRAGDGFENRIAQLVANDLHAELRYFWFVEHKTFVRRSLNDYACDVIVSVPVGLPAVATTRAYFISTYVAVMRAGDPRHFASFDDPWLREARIGVPLVGNEGATTPPVVALSRRGITAHITAFEVWAGDEQAHPQGRAVDAVADGSIDIAFVWGPFAGYFARPHGAALQVVPIAGDPQTPDLPFAYAMAMGVRKADTALRDTLQAVLDRHRAEIAAILRDDNIPTMPTAATTADAQPGSP